MKQNLVNVARRVAELGLTPVPVHGFGKFFCECGNQFCPVPAKHLITPTPVPLDQWASAYPDSATVGALLGGASGLVALDTDSMKGEARAVAMTLPQCPTTKTARGFHRLFKSVGLALLKPSVSIAPDVDLLVGNEQWPLFFAVPPSRRAGYTIEWVAGLSFDDVAIPMLPDEIAQAFICKMGNL